LSPDNAERCHCGYNFLAGSAQPSRTKRIRRALREVVKAVAGVATVVWLLAPITPWNGFVAFVTSSVVMLGCGLAWGLLATGRAERDAAMLMAEAIPPGKRVTLGGDKNYDTREFVLELPRE